MILKTKKVVEYEMIVPVPFASTDKFGSYFIVDKDGNAFYFNEQLVARYRSGGYMTEDKICEAMEGKIIPMKEAEAKLTEVLESFKQLELTPL